MKELERALLLAPLVLALLLKLEVPGAAKETAETISYTARKNGGGKTGALYDGSMAASLPLSPGDVLEVPADAPFY